MDGLHLRDMRDRDLAAVNAIYNHYVLHSTCTYQLEPEGEAGRAAWFREHGPAHPLLAAERDGTVVGWASLSRFNPRCGYATTVGNSVYVDHAWHRHGIGGTLLAELIARAQALRHHTIIAGEQAPSIALHTRFGFTESVAFATPVTSSADGSMSSTCS